MTQPGTKTLRDILGLPLTPEVDGMVRIWLDAEAERAAARRGTDDDPKYSVLDGPVTTLRRHVVLQLAATPSRTLFDAVARLGIWRSEGARDMDDAEMTRLAHGAIEDMIGLAHDYVQNKRRRIDLPE